MQDSDQLQIDLESLPGEMRPMQAASAEAPFSSPDYLFEVKWDGLRCIVFRDLDGRVRLQDRGLKDITADLPEVAAAAKRIPPGSVIDGELVATDNEGRPDYPRLRERLAGVVWPALVVGRHQLAVDDASGRDALGRRCHFWQICSDVF